MQADGRSGSTVRNTINAVRAIYRDADLLVEGGVAVNPTHGLRLPSSDGRRERIVTPKDASNLIAALPERDRALWATALYAGLRRGELRALRWQDLDLATGKIRVERSWDQLAGAVKPKSKAGRRTVPMAASLRDYLAEHRMSHADADDEALVFATPRGRTFDPSTVMERARTAWKRAEFDPIGLHDARHCCASFFIAAGANAKTISSLLGHASITITFDRYGQLFPESEDEAAALLDAYLIRPAVPA